MKMIPLLLLPFSFWSEAWGSRVSIEVDSEVWKLRVNCGLDLQVLLHVASWENLGIASECLDLNWGLQDGVRSSWRGYSFSFYLIILRGGYDIGEWSIKVESELRFEPSSFVARRKLGKVGNSFRILGFELEFARLSLRWLKRISFSFHHFLLGGKYNVREWSMKVESEL
jgi:hypothetical protein